MRGWLASAGLIGLFGGIVFALALWLGLAPWVVFLLAIVGGYVGRTLGREYFE